jgi:hypothetical protein
MDTFDWLPERFVAGRRLLMVRWSQDTSDLRAEALKALSQCEWLIRRIQALEHEDCSTDNTRNIAKRVRIAHVGPLRNYGDRDLATEIEILTEAFYYTAHRFLKIVANTGDPAIATVWRRLKNGDIVQIRNRFIDHTEKPNAVTGADFSWCEEGGPRVKPWASEAPGAGATLKREGCYRHAAELVDVLVQAVLDDVERQDAKTDE